MNKINSRYNIVIVGAGHNGLVAACYLAQAGLSVLLLEKNDYIGGATRSEKAFEGVDVLLSKYSYLISLLPHTIIKDLGLHFEVKTRATASFTPFSENGVNKGLLISNVSQKQNLESFMNFTGSDQEYKRYNEVWKMTTDMARIIWPTIMKPLLRKKEMKKMFKGRYLETVWNDLFEQPLGSFIEKSLENDLIRGEVFTNGKIGNYTHPYDETLLQNKTFFYHMVGDGTGIWTVPVGGMGALANGLIKKAMELGVTFITQATVENINEDSKKSSVSYIHNGKKQIVEGDFILVNAAPKILKKLLPGITKGLREDVEGTAYKMNMVLKKLPRLKSGYDSSKAFGGTFHIDEGYSHMNETYEKTKKGELPEKLAGEMYCHTLTDDSILSPELSKKGYQTLTLFGIDIPYHLFEKDNKGMKKIVTQKFLNGINQYLEEPIEDCFALDANGNPCIESKSAYDLENDVGLPYGNIFHTSLSWPFLEDDEEYRRWGVEIGYNNIFFCGSGAMRGGCVSGIPGHNAAMKVLECLHKL